MTNETMNNKLFKTIIQALMSKILIFVLIFSGIYICFPSNTSALQQNSSQLDAIVVTAGRLPSIFLDTPRTIAVIDKDEIQSLPVHSVQELLEYTLGVDLRQRGSAGVQADVSIRGSTFEQSLILINGIKVNDPQTGHHNFNIPVSLEDVEKIEILKGAGSSVYGPNALGGVINIITKENQKRGLTVRGTYGDFKFRESEMSLSLPIKNYSQQLSVSRKTTDGYQKNTDFDIYSFSYNSTYKFGAHSMKLLAGYLDKEFGANNFYFINPDQREHTKTTFLSAGTVFQFNQVQLSPKLYWRGNKDKYNYEFSGTPFQNDHQTEIYGFEILSTFRSNLGTTAFGGEVTGSEITSSNLGDHSRLMSGLFFEHRLSIGDKTTITPGAYANWYSDWGWKIWPGLFVNFKPAKNISLYGSASQAFRIPTYTELYYNGGPLKGDATLQAEKAWTYEIGSKWRVKGLEANLSLFRRAGYNLIDWINFSNSNIWEAKNFTKVNNSGVEVNLWLYPKRLAENFPISRLNLSYSYLSSDKNTRGFQSRYVLDYLKHQFLVQFNHPLIWKIKINWRLNYLERVEANGLTLLDSKTFINFSKMQIFFEGTNLLNRTYEDIGDIPLPGRWLRFGIVFRPAF